MRSDDRYQSGQQRALSSYTSRELIGGSTKQITQEVQPSIGFLPHPELLAPGGQGKAVLAYLNPKVNMAAYRRVLLEPVVLRAAQSSSFNGVPADQQQALANDLYAYLYNALKSHCQLVTTASPGTMRMRFALVGATKPDTLINTVATYAPYWSTGYTVTSLVLNKGVGFFAGTATGEGFAVDAASGALLWEIVDKRGRTTAFVANTLDSWRDIHNVFEAWGTQLVTRLQELGVCHACAVVAARIDHRQRGQDRQRRTIDQCTQPAPIFDRREVSPKFRSRPSPWEGARWTSDVLVRATERSDLRRSTALSFCCLSQGGDGAVQRPDRNAA
jgi:Protein of unknown function (DUF3313)